MPPVVGKQRNDRTLGLDSSLFEVFSRSTRNPPSLPSLLGYKFPEYFG